MSFNFSSLVSSIKDKSTQAMATLSSDLKEFSSIMQEDVAEVAKTVRSTVHERSETLRQRVEQRRQEEGDELGEEDEENADQEHDQEEAKQEEAPHDIAEEEEKQEEPKESAVGADDAVEAEVTEKITNKGTRRNSGSFFSFAALSLEEVGSKILQSADEILGTLTGDADDATEKDGDLDGEVENARAYRLLALQEDSATYVEEPSDMEAFTKWKQAVSVEELLEIQEEVLAQYPVVAAKRDELVSETLTEHDFWTRYLFKASQLAAQTQRSAALLEHALEEDEEDIGWDADSPRHQDVRRQESSSPVRPATAESASESESWIELDENKGSGDSKSSVSPEPLKEQDEDMDWGDDDDHEAAENTSTQGDATAVATEGDKKRGEDWGEWD